MGKDCALTVKENLNGENIFFSQQEKPSDLLQFEALAWKAECEAGNFGNRDGGQGFGRARHSC